MNYDVVIAGGSVAGLFCAREIARNGQEKVVVKVNSMKELEEVREHAISLNLPWSEVTDAGHTQIAPGTTTCISLGPAPEDLINKVTGDLKLL